MLLDRFNSGLIIKLPKSDGKIIFVNRACSRIIDKCQIKQSCDDQERHFNKFINNALFERMDENELQAGQSVPEKEDMFVNLNEIIQEQANSLDGEIHASQNIYRLKQLHRYEQAPFYCKVEVIYTLYEEMRVLAVYLHKISDDISQFGLRKRLKDAEKE